MNHAIIVHGWKSKPESNWKPWLKKELEATGAWNVDVPAMPNPEHPAASEWTEKLMQTVGRPTTNTYLIGHSLGCITILRYLETLSENEKVGGVIMIAGFGEKFSEYKGQHDTFFDHELDWTNIREHCDKFVAIHSDNDPFIKLDQMDLFKNKLQAKGIVLHDKGHFGSEDGIFEVPFVFEELQKLLV
ncbi:MAG TPA: alpha/beta hydrolase [Candidatus Saccharimonadales bacterium]|nr:alpha/beta hydrolase [Candidatus Saccharimonadales bacterium]